MPYTQVANLTPDQLKHREVVYIDIAADKVDPKVGYECPAK